MKIKFKEIVSLTKSVFFSSNKFNRVPHYYYLEASFVPNLLPLPYKYYLLFDFVHLYRQPIWNTKKYHIKTMLFDSFNQFSVRLEKMDIFHFAFSLIGGYFEDINILFEMTWCYYYLLNITQRILISLKECIRYIISLTTKTETAWATSTVLTELISM